jgi:acetyl-CoA carboxylase biotin carboxylase subunit
MPGGPGIRIDSAIYQGYTITPYYDSMIAKLIVHAPTRNEAIKKMKLALSEFIVDGVDTNIDFQLELIRNKNFDDGDYDNGFLNRYMQEKAENKL